jgi:hypothetical protein
MRHVFLTGLLLIVGCDSPPAGAPDMATMTPPPDLLGADLAGADLTSAPQDLAAVLYDLAASADGAAGLRLLNDEFQVAATLPDWSDLFPLRHDVLSIANDVMTIQPVQQNNNHWYSDDQGPLLFKTVSGNFVVETAVHVGRRDDINMPPGASFNAAGFVIRDATSSSPRNQRWVMYNIGFQDSAIARETKTTVGAASGASLSTLYLNNTPGAVTLARLRVCRIGNTFHFFYRHPGDSAWIEETYGAGTRVSGNGPNGQTMGQPLRFTRADMPASLQVGIMTGAWGGALNSRGEFDYVRFSEASQLSDCTADFAF